MRYIFSTKNIAILREMVVTDFKVRYQGSVLGYMWSLLKPLMLFAIIYIVFTYIIPLGKGVAHYPIYLLIGIVLWSFFTEITSLGASSIVSRGELIRKISIPRYLIVLASSISALINLFLSLIVILIFALINNIDINVGWTIAILPIVELYAIGVGAAFFLSSLYVKYRDITYIWEIVLQAGFYATPIIYPLSSIDQTYQKWFFISPIAQAIQDVRYLLVSSSTPTVWSLGGTVIKFIPFTVGFIVILSGITYFRKRSKFFAEDI